MGNIGGIEKIMVFGILLIIITILGIAFYSANKIENDLTPTKVTVADNSDLLKLSDSNKPDRPLNNAQKRTAKPPFRDVNRPGPRQQASLQPLKANNIQPDAGLPKDPAGRTGRPDEGQAMMTPAEKNKPLNLQDPEPALITEYEVKKGDSFMQIARTLYGDERKSKDIMNANPAVDPWNLQVGQRIKLPEPISINGAVKKKEREPSDASNGDKKTYVVQSGDTLVEISEKFYGNTSSWKKIYQANRDRIKDPDLLRVGTRLVIP